MSGALQPEFRMVPTELEPDPTALTRPEIDAEIVKIRHQKQAQIDEWERLDKREQELRRLYRSARRG